MIEILAAVEQVTQQGPTPVQVWGPYGAVIVALGGPRALSLLLGFLRPNGNGNGNGKYNKALCDERHEAIERKLDLLLEHAMGKRK